MQNEAFACHAALLPVIHLQVRRFALPRHKWKGDMLVRAKDDWIKDRGYAFPKASSERMRARGRFYGLIFG